MTGRGIEDSTARVGATADAMFVPGVPTKVWGPRSAASATAGIPAIQVRFSRFRSTIQPGPVQRQETQIVQS